MSKRNRNRNRSKSKNMSRADEYNNYLDSMYDSEDLFNASYGVDPKDTNPLNPFNPIVGLSGKWTVPTCTHWRTPVPIGEYTVWASSYRDMPKEIKKLEEKPWPDLGIYLDDAWAEALTGMTSCGIETPVLWHWPFVSVTWWDFSVPSEWVTETLVDYVASLIEQGKQIEIGCVGAHGRTGTLLALLKVKLDKVKAEDAIEAIRTDYCEEAIEGVKQRDAIYTFSGEEPPPLPPVAPAVVTNYKLGSTALGLELCDNCAHAEDPHKRGKERFNIDRCAYLKFNDKESWECSCTKYVHVRKTSSVPMPSDEELAEGEGGQDLLTENFVVGNTAELEEANYYLTTFGNDICKCGETRAEHLPTHILGGECTVVVCKCESFYLSKAVD